MYFANSLRPIPSIGARDLQNSQGYENVTPIGWSFSEQPIAAQFCWRGRGGKILNIIGRNKFFSDHYVPEVIKQ